MNYRKLPLALASALIFWHFSPVALAQSGSAAPNTEAQAVPSAGDYIVAVVNSEPITNQEVQSDIRRIKAQLAAQNRPSPPAAELARQVLERRINDKIQLQLAQDMGVRVDSVAIDQAEQGVARSNQTDLAGLHKRLALDGVTVAQFRAQLKEQLTLTRLREREVEPRVRVTDLEVDQFLRDQRKAVEETTTAINLAQILVAVPENATPEQLATLQTKAQGLFDRARRGDDFATLAINNSNADDGANGGQLGLRAPDRLPTLFLQATQNLAVGGLAGPIRSGAGFHILKVLERKTSNLPAMTVSQSRASHILLRPSAKLSEAEAISKLNELKKRVESGNASFASLAQSNSQDGSAVNGGDLGWTNPGTFVPEFEAAMNALKPGEISAPLVSRFGVHLILLSQRRVVAVSEKDQREIVRNTLREKKFDEVYTRWADDLRARAYVELRDAPQ